MYLYCTVALLNNQLRRDKAIQVVGAEAVGELTKGVTDTFCTTICDRGQTKVNSQFKIFAIVNSQTPLYLLHICGKIGQGQGKFQQ